MVKSYNRFELAQTFGIISSGQNIVHIPNGKSAGSAACAAGEAVLVWDVKTSEQTKRLVDPQQSPQIVVTQLAYEPQNELLASGYSDGSIRVWDMRTSSVLIVFNGHRSFISCLQFSADGIQLFSGSSDTTIIVWDLVNEQGLYRLTGSKAPITALLLVNDDRTLISFGKDGIMKLWDMETQFCTETKLCHRGEVWSATQLNIENKIGFATVGNLEIRLWQLNLESEEGEQISLAGEMLKEGKHRGVSLVYSNEILTCASGDIVQSWKLRTPEELKKLVKRRAKRSKDKETKETKETPELTLADHFMNRSMFRTKAKITGIWVYNSDILVNLNTNSLEVWSIKDEPEQTHLVDLPGHRTDIRDLSISRNNKLVATGSNGTVKIHSLVSHQVIRTLTDTGYILALSFLPGDELVVYGTKEGKIELYDIVKAVKIGSIDAHAGAVWSLDISTDGKFMVTGGADKTVKFWSFKVIDAEVPGRPDLPGVATMSLKNTHKLEFNDDVLAVKLSADMQLVAASLLDSTIKVYKVETLKFFLNLYGHQLPVLSLDISHDNKILVSSSADKNVKIWGLDFGDCHKSIFAHDDSVLRVKFEPNSYNFLTSSKDGMVKYWDGQKFVQIQALKAHHSEVWALDFASNGMFAVSASHDKTIRVWDLTDEPLFIEEEREQELEEQFEENFVDQLARDEAHSNLNGNAEDGEEENGNVESVSKYSTESLKASERLYEALDICAKELKNDGSEPKHIILTALDVTPEQYLMDVLAKIRPALVEDALLTFPLDRVVNLLTFVDMWLDRKWNIQLVCRVLFFCLRNFHKQLTAAKMLQPELESIRDKVRTILLEENDKIGFNLEYLAMLQTKWAESHERYLEPETETQSVGTTDQDLSTADLKIKTNNKDESKSGRSNQKRMHT